MYNKYIDKYNKYIDKLVSSQYLSKKIVLLIDVIMSVVSSGVALGILFFIRSITLSFNTVAIWLLSATMSSLIMFLLLKTYRSVIRYSTLRDISRLLFAVLGKVLLLALVLVLLLDVNAVYTVVLLFIDCLVTLFLLVSMRVGMILVYDLAVAAHVRNHNRKRVLIYGILDKSVALITRLRNSPHYDVVGFITTTKDNSYRTVSALNCYICNNADDLQYLQHRLEVDAILFASTDDARSQESMLIKHAREKGIKVLISPSIDEVIDGRIMKNSIREVKIEDLLGRSEIEFDVDQVQKEFNDKVVMVTGAAGSIGSELCRQLASIGVKRLVLFDNAETPMHNIRLELEERFHDLDFVPLIGDVRLKARLDYAFKSYRPQIVFHAAAYKHVPLMEENPCESVLVNVVGSRNVADKCIEYGVEKMVMVSTDKAVNPTNVMGCTKRLAEIYVQSLGLAIEHGKIKGNTKFVTTRFGNVLGSNGSVIPRFRDQIAKGGPVTVTHPEITRFFMTIPEACRLVMQAATLTEGNQIFVFDMGKSVKIVDMACRMIELAGFVPNKDIQIEFTGLRPGEKLYEEVLSNKENTIPTKNNRIHIAKVRDYDYEDAVKLVNDLEILSRDVNVPDMIRLMKRSVPEFKSKNSIYEKYDNEKLDL